MSIIEPTCTNLQITKYQTYHSEGHNNCKTNITTVGSIKSWFVKVPWAFTFVVRAFSGLNIWYLDVLHEYMVL
jgi:peroxiredoxin